MADLGRGVVVARAAVLAAAGGGGVVPTVTLYQGDCLEVLPTLAAGSVGAVVTDPPYGEQTHTGALTWGYKDEKNAVPSIDFMPLDAGGFVDVSNALVELSAGWVIMTCEWRYMH